MTAIERCLELARFSETPGCITRTFLSPPMRDVHHKLREWMEPLGMRVWIDDAGNLHGLYPGRTGRRLIIGSHVDSVPNAGAYDGVLGVTLAISLIEALKGELLPYSVEIVAFSEEEGVRFGVPFIGSRALTGALDEVLLNTKDKQGITVSEAIRGFGLDPTEIPLAAIDVAVTIGYLEFHIEQGPVLESLHLPLGLVTAINGQSRHELTFQGQPNHAGTTPMHLRRDALVSAAEWIVEVERTGQTEPGLVATVGRIAVTPGAGNVIPGAAYLSLDVRHSDDAIRVNCSVKIIEAARRIGQRRSIDVSTTELLNQSAVPCDAVLTEVLEASLQKVGHPVHKMGSGAGHDAMIMAERVPIAMLFMRSPGGISHHPDETVLPGDVQAAIDVGCQFLLGLEQRGVSGLH